MVVSSAPQIRYPDCYGIDMAKLEDFIAFKATLELLKEFNKTHILDEIYKKCKTQDSIADDHLENYVREMYKPFTAEQISDKIAQLLKTKDIKADVKVIFQSIEGLHKACTKNEGDWYFTGKYPTIGGTKVVNRAFINFYEGKNKRAY